LAGRPVRVEVDGVSLSGRLESDAVVLEDGRVIPEAETKFLPPVRPSKIIGVHLAYRSRVEEYGIPDPATPSYFMKPPTSLTGHRAGIRKARGSRFLNYEGELAVVIAQRMSFVAEEEALDYVAGYACANDVGMHDFRHADRGSMLRVKGQDGFLPLGPAVVSAAEFDPTAFVLRTILNGDVVQEASAEDLIFSAAYQLADLSRLITLEPGDVLLTGTPANSRPMEVGDVVEVEISGLGRLANTVVDWDVDLTASGAQMEVTSDALHVALAVTEAEAQALVASGGI
jgi:5-oxopent-3-ene-1,2,5-tricarboxylate decarboxylase/2-hydroxyhepta-2,4-diene-1,7-dioate isomerase